MTRKRINLRFVILVLLTGIALASCKKDETTTNNLVGTWTAGTSTMTATVGTQTLTEYFINDVGLTADEAALYVGVIDQAFKQAFTGTITVKSDMTYTSNMGGTADTGTWSLSADRTKLTIDSSTDVPVTYDVTELTASKLQLHMSEAVSEDLNGDGLPETINIEADVNFTK
jgi:type IV pilus biogenesis protein CpaD/CtpE